MSDQHEQQHLSVWDGISIIVGIVVGVSIFKTPPDVFGFVAGPWQVIGVWVLGGFLSFVGALCYAELGTAYPHAGGDYAYLKRAFGGGVAFLFGWSQLAATLTGSIGTMAFVFADYAKPLLTDSFGLSAAASAGLVVAALTVANILGAKVGKTVQNVLAIVKIAGLAGIVLFGFLAGGSHAMTRATPAAGQEIGLAMIFVLYAYGGWNDAAFVATEVRDREKNIPRVLLAGIGLIVVIYLIVNLGYLRGLGYDGVRESKAPAADVLAAGFEKLSTGWGVWGGRGMSVLVMISALGAINGLLFTGSRVYASMGHDHRLFAFLRRWDPRLNTPVWSLASSGAVALAMIFVLGTDAGRNLIDAVVTTVGLPAIPWGKYGGGFETLVASTAPVFWTFFFLTGVSLVVLRIRDPQTPRPFKVPLYPLEPILFCGTSLYMLYRSLLWAGPLSLVGLIPLASGIPLYFLGRGSKPAE